MSMGHFGDEKQHHLETQVYQQTVFKVHQSLEIFKGQGQHILSANRIVLSTHNIIHIFKSINAH